MFFMGFLDCTTLCEHNTTYNRLENCTNMLSIHHQPSHLQDSLHFVGLDSDSGGESGDSEPEHRAMVTSNPILPTCKLEPELSLNFY